MHVAGMISCTEWNTVIKTREHLPQGLHLGSRTECCSDKRLPQSQEVAIGRLLIKTVCF